MIQEGQPILETPQGPLFRQNRTRQDRVNAVAGLAATVRQCGDDEGAAVLDKAAGKLCERK